MKRRSSIGTLEKHCAATTSRSLALASNRSRADGKQ
nr:MAG TPA: hypothetical protein [Caudoviricetes sp.]